MAGRSKTYQVARAHACGPKCSHRCGEAGGRDKKGTPCNRPGAWGVTGTKTWTLALCKDHDPTFKGPKVPKKGGKSDSLSGREQRFVLAWCGPANCNGTKAARLAGYAGDSKVLGIAAIHLLRRPHVRAEIDKWFDELAAPANEVVARLTTAARASVADLIVFDAAGNPVLKLTPENLLDYQNVIKEIETDPETGAVTKVKLHDNLRALQELAKIRHLYHEGPEVVNVHVHAQGMTDAELRQEIARLMRLEEEAMTHGRGREKAPEPA